MISHLPLLFRDFMLLYLMIVKVQKFVRASDTSFERCQRKIKSRTMGDRCLVDDLGYAIASSLCIKHVSKFAVLNQAPRSFFHR